MGYNMRKGFTLIELIMVIVIIGILAGSGAYLMMYLVQNSVFIPNQLNMDMAAAQALDIMSEGDSGAKGLRFSRAITSVANNQVVFVNQDSQNISYRLDAGTKKLYRSIAAGPEAPIPYYVVTGVNITAPGNQTFTYYDASEAVTAVAVNVRRIKMALIATSGTGAYADWQGQSQQNSSIQVNKYQ